MENMLNSENSITTEPILVNIGPAYKNSILYFCSSQDRMSKKPSHANVPLYDNIEAQSQLTIGRARNYLFLINLGTQSCDTVPETQLRHSRLVLFLQFIKQAKLTESSTQQCQCIN